MTLELLLNIICDLAIKRNLVNYSAAGSSIYELNTKTVDSYPFIFVSPTGSIVTRKNFTDYGLTLFYVERLLEDNANDTRTYSIANDTLVNLVRQLRQLTGIVEITEPSVRLFNDERLNDRCCGAYAEITVTVLNEAECPVIFDEEGEFMGTYIPETLKEVDILDSLASKDWVARYVAEHSSEGMTEEQVKKLINNALKAYTKSEKFATINGSGITNNEIYNLLETAEFNSFLSGYTQEIQNIYQAVSAATPEGYEEVKQQVSANTENISILSAFTSGLSFTVSEHTQNIEQLSQIVASGFKVYVMNHHRTQDDINEMVRVALDTESPNFARIVLLFGINTATGGGQYIMLRPYNKNFPFPYDTSDAYFSGIYPVSETKYSLYTIGFTQNSMDVEVHREDYDSREFVTQTAYTQDIQALSGITSGLSEDFSTLSGTVSEHTESIEQIESAITGINETLVVLSAQTSGNTAQISANTTQIVELSGATSDALTGLSTEISELSGATGDLGLQVAALLGEVPNTAFFNLLKDYGDTSNEVSRLYQDMNAANASGKTLILISAFQKSTQDIAVFVFCRQDGGTKDFFGYGGGIYYDGSSLMIARAVPIIRNGTYMNITPKNGHLYLDDFNSK